MYIQPKKEAGLRSTNRNRSQQNCVLGPKRQPAAQQEEPR